MTEARIAYVVSRWGEPTQTFVRREVKAVKAAGCDVRVLSLKKPCAAEWTREVTWLPVRDVVVGALAAFAVHPLLSLGVVAAVLRRSRLRNIGPQLAAAVIGLAWAGRGLTPDRHLHAHFGWVAATAAWSAATVSRRPYSVVLHAFELHTRKHVDRFTPVPLRAAARVFTISERDREHLVKQWRLQATVLRMGVPRQWTLDDGQDRDPWLVVSVGSLVPKKGHDVLVEAIAAADPRWKLVIIGEGRLREQLEAQAGSFGIGSRVRFLGHQGEDEVRAWLHRAAVSCLASVETEGGDRDGIPVSLMEAMACGAAVIASDVGAISELVEGAGLLVQPGDPYALARAIDLLRDDDSRRPFAATGRSRVIDGFLAERCASPVLDLIGIRSDASVRPE